MSDFSFYVPISKVEKQKDGSVLVSGYASTPALDLDGEIVSIDAIKKALPGYWEWRNIREMHQPSAVGVGKEYSVDKDGWFLTSKITDPTAAQKCLDEVYKGYSIGGRKLSKDGNIITDVELIEVSLVDRPANPDCKISIAKKAKEVKSSAGFLVKAKATVPKYPRGTGAKAIAKMAQAVELLAKEGPPAAHDGFSLPAKKIEQASPRDKEVQNNKASGACEEHGVVGCKDCMDKSGDPPEEMPSKKSKKKAKKEAKKLAKKAAREKRLKKSVEITAPLSKKSDNSTIDGFRSAVNTYTVLGKSQELVSPEVEEAQEDSADLPDDEFVSYLLESSKMEKLAVSNGSVSDLDTAVLNIIKRSMVPSREKRMTIARGNLGKARKARKEAEEEVKNCHAAISKRYMAKMAKAGKNGKKPFDDDDDDDMAETEKVLKSLQKAYSALTTMKTFIKAADSHLEKAASRSGQRGQEVNDPPGDVPYNKPPVKDLSPGEMASAGGGGQPPMYPTDGGVYPGKMAKLADRNGMVPVAVAEVLAENARLEAQVSVLGRVSNSSGSRPYAFDMSKVYGGEGQGDRSSERQNAGILLNGVNPNDLQSSDENVRNRAAATTAGNYLLSAKFGKSIVDPDFRGKAGMGRSA